MIKHGIEDEHSDIRVHVFSNMACVFETQKMRDYLQSSRSLIQASASTEIRGTKIKTSHGILVPVSKCEFICEVVTGEAAPVFGASDHTEKGRWAAGVVALMARRGILPLFIRDASESWERSVQLEGTDVIVQERFLIQTKCDLRISETGNLFIQTHEINPLQKH